jgi:hypothetical protein
VTACPRSSKAHAVVKPTTPPPITTQCFIPPQGLCLRGAG